MTMIWKFSLDAPVPVIAVTMPEGARKPNEVSQT